MVLDPLYVDNDVPRGETLASHTKHPVRLQLFGADPPSWTSKFKVFFSTFFSSDSVFAWSAQFLEGFGALRNFWATAILDHVNI